MVCELHCYSDLFLFHRSIDEITVNYCFFNLKGEASSEAEDEDFEDDDESESASIDGDDVAVAPKERKRSYGKSYKGKLVGLQRRVCNILRCFGIICELT